MGKKSKGVESEPLFSPLKTTDDDDEPAAGGGGPATRYRDDPQASPASNGDDDGGPAVRYRDDPGGSIFDWADGGADGNGGGGEATVGNRCEAGGEGGADTYRIDDEFDHNSVGFSPVSLHDDEGGDDEENGGNGLDDSENERVRLHANDVLKRRIFDDTTYDEEDDRIFVGGGWGRHGSQFSLCPRGLCSCCGGGTPKYSRGPRPKKSYTLCQAVCMGMAFLALVIGAGYVGYEAGLPIEDGDVSLGEDETADDSMMHHTHTKGEEWLHWLEHETEEIKTHHWNFTFHHPRHPKLPENDDEAFRKSHFEPKSQAELLHLSEQIFQSCSERSLRTTMGRDACLSHCHGHYCCFEKDIDYGSCVAEPNSYCFAYAACENLIGDFDMNNANTASKENGGDSHDVSLNAIDQKLLADTCSKANIATLEGIRDCTAFCQHHLCCFNELESENCRDDHKEECGAYNSCGILVYGPGDPGNTANSNNDSQNDKNNDVTKHTFKEDCNGPNLRQNWESCKSHCASFECCFRIQGSCYEMNELECDQFNSCEVFFLDEEIAKDEENGDSSNVINKASPSGNAPLQHTFKEDCNESTLQQNYESCKVHCASFECCFRTQGSCYEQNSLECDEYYICEEFFLDDDEIDEEKMEINANNKNDAINGAPSPSQGASDHSNMSVNKDIENAVHAVCGLEDERPGDDTWVAACHALCANYLCCFSTDGTASNCRDTYGDDLCNAYQGCVVLHTSAAEDPPSLSSSALPLSSSALEEQNELAAVTEACTPRARRDPWLADKCQKACDVRRCCFEPGPGNCSRMNEKWCDEFHACELLYT